jgi:hypothetical protein
VAHGAAQVVDFGHRQGMGLRHIDFSAELREQQITRRS